MRRHVKRACAATVAASAAVALAAGMTTPASAKPEQRAAGAAQTGATQLGAAQARLKGSHHITLITGDRVTLDAKGRVAGLEPHEGP